MDEWRTRLATYLTRGDVAELPEVLLLIGALAGCSTFAMIQFFTMLGTRWGDKNPAPKSFVLSILVHVVVMLAWSTAIAIRPVNAVMALPKNVGEAIPIREVAEQDPEDPFDQGETPIWKKLTEKPLIERVRQDRESDAPEEMADAPLQPVETPAIDPADLADLNVQPTAAESPQQQLSPAEPFTQPAPAPVTEMQTETTAEARAEAGARLPARATMRRTNELEFGEETPKTRGAEDAAAPNRPDDQSMSIPLETAGDQDESPVLDGPANETIRRGVAPAPSNAPDGEFIPDGRTDADGPPKSRAKRFERAKSRQTSEGDDDSPIPDRTPGDDRAVASLTPSRPAVTGPGDLTGKRPSPSLATGVGPNLPNRSPATYKLRKLQQRRGTALQQGGSLQSELAVENSLKWLAKNQEPGGFWSSRKHGGGSELKDPAGLKVKDADSNRMVILTRTNDGSFADPGVTGLALLAFMGAGYTQDEGDYADHVTRAILWLIRQQRDDGYLGGRAASYDQMYCHAIATFALGEACAMQDEAERSPELRRAIRLAVDFIVEHQGTDGGWRYLKKFDQGQEGDMSMFGWQLMALKSADIAGIKVDPQNWNLMVEFLKKRSQGDHNGLASYNSSQPNPTPAMTAEALFCKQMIGIRRTNPACQEAIGYLRQNLPRITKYDEYYWYYGTLAMFQHGGEAWEEWNQTTRDLLLNLQETSGKDAGSWAPNGKWAGIGGRVYSTAISTLCLEVYYRYLPLYQTTQE